MFKIQITAINPSAEPFPHGGTSALIPDYLVAGGDRLIDCTISIDSPHPYKGGKVVYEGNRSIFAEWLPDQYGMRGKRVGDTPSPANVLAALKSAYWLDWKIIEGHEILEIPTAIVAGRKY
jgi:hypothetical protein